MHVFVMLNNSKAERKVGATCYSLLQNLASKTALKGKLVRVYEVKDTNNGNDTIHTKVEKLLKQLRKNMEKKIRGVRKYCQLAYVIIAYAEKGWRCWQLKIMSTLMQHMIWLYQRSES